MVIAETSGASRDAPLRPGWPLGVLRALRLGKLRCWPCDMAYGGLLEDGS